jgi:hypothetical protein
MYLANMGSVYDLPVVSSRADNRTQADTSMAGSSWYGANQGFEKTERAVRKRPFDTFYTSNVNADNPPVPVKYAQQNRFEGKSNYFHYVPTDTLTEQRMECVWFEHQNKKLQEKRRDEEAKQTMY